MGFCSAGGGVGPHLAQQGGMGWRSMGHLVQVGSGFSPSSMLISPETLKAVLRWQCFHRPSWPCRRCEKAFAPLGSQEHQ